MPRSLPEVSVLLDAVTHFLESDVYQRLSGRERYLLRVSINVLKIIGREISLGAALDGEDRAGLSRLLGEDGPAHELAARLADRIETGAIAIEDDDLRNLLRDSVGRALRINNPKWLEG